MSFTRREFLKSCGRGMGSAAMLTALSYAARENAYAQGSDYRALVCIFLEGGNDGWNTMVPLDQAAYNTYAAGRQGWPFRREASCRLPSQAGNFGSIRVFPACATCGIRAAWPSFATSATL